MRVLLDHPDYQVVEYPPALRTITRSPRNINTYNAVQFPPTIFVRRTYRSTDRRAQGNFYMLWLGKPFTRWDQKVFLARSVCLGDNWRLYLKDIKFLVHRYWTTPLLYDQNYVNEMFSRRRIFDHRSTCKQVFTDILGKEGFALLKEQLIKDGNLSKSVGRGRRSAVLPKKEQRSVNSKKPRQRA